MSDLEHVFCVVCFSLAEVECLARKIIASETKMNCSIRLDHCILAVPAKKVGSKQ